MQTRGGEAQDRWPDNSCWHVACPLHLCQPPAPWHKNPTPPARVNLGVGFPASPPLLSTSCPQHQSPDVVLKNIQVRVFVFLGVIRWRFKLNLHLVTFFFNACKKSLKTRQASNQLDGKRAGYSAVSCWKSLLKPRAGVLQAGGHPAALC